MPPPDAISSEGVRRLRTRGPQVIEGGTLGGVIARKDFRNILQLRPKVTCCDGKLKSSSYDTGYSQEVGYTPRTKLIHGDLPVPATWPMQGDAGPPSVLAQMNPSGDCVKFTARARFRVNDLENYGQAFANARGLFPYAWSQISAVICCTKSGARTVSATFTGSSIPSHDFYRGGAREARISMRRPKDVPFEDKMAEFVATGKSDDAPQNASPPIPMR